MNQLKKILTRLKNTKVFLAVASGILLILVNLNIIDNQLFDQYMEIVNIVLGIGVAVGVFANPEKDKQPTTNLK